MFSLLTIFNIIFLISKIHGIDSLNPRPIIGVVTEETNSTIVPEAKSKILASYVKFLESGGARVVPIWVYKPKDYYRQVMKNINGILFPGGPGLITSKGYGKTGKYIFEIATELNEKGDYFPLWGTCLGFELLNYLAVNKRWFKTCAAEDLATNIEFVGGYKDGKLFQDLDVSLKNIMRKEKVAIHYHRWCLTPQNYTLSGLDKYFRVLALNKDLNNDTFVSIVEAYKYPFYGVSFHPEKILFEWYSSKGHQNMPHNLDAARTSQYFANFIVNEARKSAHHFTTKEEEDTALIYNYSPVFTGKLASNTDFQIYYFTQ